VDLSINPLHIPSKEINQLNTSHDNKDSANKNWDGRYMNMKEAINKRDINTHTPKDWWIYRLDPLYTPPNETPSNPAESKPG